jgi:hypothetical protein
MLTTLGLGSGALFSFPAIARIAGFDAGSRREALAAPACHSRFAGLASAHAALSDRFRAATKLQLINGRSKRRPQREASVGATLAIAICVVPMLDFSRMQGLAQCLHGEKS